MGTGAASILEAAEIAAASGVYRAQNTSTITTGRIRAGDKKRSAIAFGVSGLMAFAGAALWRWLPCRNIPSALTQNATENTKYVKCYNEDGQRRGLETPTKALLGAGVALEVVSLVYWIAHFRQGDDGRGIVRDASEGAATPLRLRGQTRNPVPDTEPELANRQAAREQEAAAAAEGFVTNDDVIAMVGRGLSDAIVVRKIETSPCRFDTSTDGLVALTEAGVPEPIILRMIDARCDED